MVDIKASTAAAAVEKRKPDECSQDWQAATLVSASGRLYLRP